VRPPLQAMCASPFNLTFEQLHVPSRIRKFCDSSQGFRLQPSDHQDMSALGGHSPVFPSPLLRRLAPTSQRDCDPFVLTTVSLIVRLGLLRLRRQLVLSHDLRSLSLSMVNASVLLVSWSKGVEILATRRLRKSGRTCMQGRSGALELSPPMVSEEADSIERRMVSSCLCGFGVSSLIQCRAACLPAAETTLVTRKSGACWTCR